MHHPWRWARDNLPGWRVVFAPLPDGVFGLSDPETRTITIDDGLSQAQRRCTLDHEVAHAAAGDVGRQHEHRERAINEESARRLIPLPALLDACVWAHDVDELAEELWADVPTVECRLATLTDAERAAVRKALAERDFHEEGWD